MAAAERAVRAQPRVPTDLAPEAVEILLRAVNGQRQQGTVLITRPRACGASAEGFSEKWRAGLLVVSNR